MNRLLTSSKIRTVYSSLKQLGFWLSVLTVFGGVYGFFGETRSGKIFFVVIFLVGIFLDRQSERSLESAAVRLRLGPFTLSRKLISRLALTAGLAGVYIAERSALTGTPSRFGYLTLLLPVWAVLLRIPIRDAEERGNSFFAVWNPEIWILGLTALMLTPMLEGGYYWDDAVNATVYGAERFDAAPLWLNLSVFIQKYFALGRVNVLSVYYYFFFLLRNPLIYKTLILLFILLNQFLSGMIVRKITGSKRMGQLVMLIALLCFQMRPYQDALTGFYALMQLILVELLLTAYWLIKYVREGKPRYLVASVSAFAMGLFTYEVVFPFLLMIPVIAWAESRKVRRVVAVSLPYVAVWLAAVGAVAYVRLNLDAGLGYSGAAFSWDWTAILRTWLRQTVAGLPLNFHTFGTEAAILSDVTQIDQVFNFTPVKLLFAMNVLDFVLAAIAAWLIFRVFSRLRPDARPGSLRTLAALGASLFLLSGVSIALSLRYQGQLVPGLGYLPAYLGYYGTAMLTTALIGALSSCFRTWRYADRWILKGLTAAYVVVFVVTLQENRSVLNLLDRAFSDPYRAGCDALAAGIFDFLPGNAAVLTTNPGDYLWEANWNETGIEGEFWTMESGRNFLNGTLRAGRFPAAGEAFADPGAPVYAFEYGGNELGTFAKLGRVVEVRTEADGGRSVLTDGVIYFMGGNFLRRSDVSYLNGTGEFMRLSGEAMLRVREDRRGTIFHLPEAETLRFETLDVVGF